jgi:hypothetical protein
VISQAEAPKQKKILKTQEVMRTEGDLVVMLGVFAVVFFSSSFVRALSPLRCCGVRKGNHNLLVEALGHGVQRWAI